MNYYVSVLKNYVGFGGRAGRAEFWWFTLVNFVISLVLMGVDAAIKNAVIDDLYALAILLPSLAVSFRRLHDTGRTAWWLLIGIIPIIGAITLIVFWCQDGTPGSNKYGENPKGIGGPYGTGPQGAPYAG